MCVLLLFIVWFVVQVACRKFRIKSLFIICRITKSVQTFVPLLCGGVFFSLVYQVFAIKKYGKLFKFSFVWFYLVINIQHEMKMLNSSVLPLREKNSGGLTIKKLQIASTNPILA